MFAHCKRDGEIFFSLCSDIEHAVMLCEAPHRVITDVLLERAELGPDRETRFVPGVADAPTEQDALVAVHEFRDRLQHQLEGRL